MANPHPKPGPGRPKGCPNKITLEIKEIAQQYGERAIKGLLRLAENARNEGARVAAWKELLDRGYGKSPQAIIGDPDHPIRFETVRRLIVEPGHTDSESISTSVEPSPVQGGAWGERIGEEPFLRRLDDRRRDH